MKGGTPVDYVLFKHADSKNVFKVFEDLFNNNFYANYSEKPKIPKIIH